MSNAFSDCMMSGVMGLTLSGKQNSTLLRPLHGDPSREIEGLGETELPASLGPSHLVINDQVL